MILFMRHGETTANASGYLAGETDVPLSEKGKQQAIEAAKDPIFKSINVIIASTLSRTQETADPIIDQLDEVLLMSSPLLNEAGFSNCKTIEEFFQGKGNESVEEVELRAVVFLQWLSDFYLSNNRQPMLIVGHKWWYYIMADKLDDLIPQKELDNCEVVDITNLIVDMSK